MPVANCGTVIGIRSDEGAAPAETERVIPEAIMRIVGHGAELARVRTSAEELLTRMGETADTEPARVPQHEVGGGPA